jgi:hypothetical protein
MFGNRLGWGLAAVIALGVFGLVALVASMNQPSKPSRGAIDKQGKYVLELPTRPEMSAEIVLPFDLKSVVPTATKAGDAAPLYREALAEVKADKYRYDPKDRFKGKPSVAKDYPALAKLIEARELTSMKLFAARPEEVVTPVSLVPEPLDLTLRMGTKAAQLAQWEMDYDKDEALKLAEAVVSLGYKLCQERVRFYEYEGGSTLIVTGCYVIAKLDPTRAPAAQAASDAMTAYMKTKGMPLMYAITSVDPSVMGRTAGDMFWLAANAKERMYRTEAWLKLGQYKFNAGEPGNAADQRHARTKAGKAMNDASEDPIVRLAAKLAYEMTREDYAKVGVK